MRKMIHNKLFIGIVVGYGLCFCISHQDIVTSLLPSYNDNEAKKNNKIHFLNKDVKLRRAFLDIRKYEGFNYLAVNKGLKHMERFMKIRHNFSSFENTFQFYSLAKMERKKSLFALRGLLFHSQKRASRKVLKIIKYIAKVSKHYLYEMAQINNDRWNDGDTSQNPIYVDELASYDANSYAN